MSKLRAIKNFLKSTAGIGPDESVRSLAKSNPLITFGLAAPAVGFAGTEIVAPIARGLSETDPFRTFLGREERDQQRYENYVEGQRNRVVNTLQSQRIEEMVRPRRQDLMEELAYAMGTSSSPEDFSSLVS